MTNSDLLVQLIGQSPSPESAVRWREYVMQNLPEFRRAVTDIPIPSGPGSLSIAEAFWLFRLVAELRPSAVIDSGSATGWSAFVIAAAAPTARIHCFDPFCAPKQLPPLALHYPCDWTAANVKFPSDTLVLFDDHVNQRRRVRQARRAGIKNVLFHDVYRVLTKSTVSLTFVDLIGLVERAHTFEPLWFTDPIFMETTSNTQMYRWLTWLQLTAYRPFSMRSLIVSAAQRHQLRNPLADNGARRNWGARL